MKRFVVFADKVMESDETMAMKAAKISHRFVEIHPFSDFNGRLSRLLITMVLILVKGWEPPLLDCMDVLRSLRTRVGSQTSLIVVPLALDVGAPRANELDAWHHAVSRLADPGTYVEALK